MMPIRNMTVYFFTVDPLCGSVVMNDDLLIFDFRRIRCFNGDTALYAGHGIVRFSLIVICFNRVKVLESWTLNCCYIG